MTTEQLFIVVARQKGQIMECEAFSEARSAERYADYLDRRGDRDRVVIKPAYRDLPFAEDQLSDDGF